MSGEIFGAWAVNNLVFPSPNRYQTKLILSSFRFSVIDVRNIPCIPPNWLVIFLKSWTSTGFSLKLNRFFCNYICIDRFFPIPSSITRYLEPAQFLPSLFAGPLNPDSSDTQIQGKMIGRNIIWTLRQHSYWDWEHSVGALEPAYSLIGVVIKVYGKYSNGRFGSNQKTRLEKETKRHIMALCYQPHVIRGRGEGGSEKLCS